MRKYPTIEVDVDGSTSFHCLNEFSLRSSIIKTFVVDVHVDDLYFETFRGDGLVVSTQQEVQLTINRYVVQLLTRLSLASK